MNGFRRGLVGSGIPVLAIGVFAALLGFSLMRLSQIERDMRIEATQNMLWVISRAHVASLGLSEAIAHRAPGQSGGSDVDLRYNIFLSRLALLNEGPQLRRMEALGFASEILALENSADSLPRLLAELDAGASDAAATIQSVLDPFNSLLGRAANAAMVAEWDELGLRLDTYRDHLWQIIASLAAISLAGGFLSVRLLLAVREARHRTHQLQREKAFSELLIGSSGAGILAVDREQCCTVWNGAMERLFYRPARDAAGLPLRDISGFFEVERVQLAVQAALVGEATSVLDQAYFRPNSEVPLYIDLRCFSLRNRDEIIGAILLISDVTARHLAQTELSRHRDHLEELVEARTAELDEALERERATADLYRNFAAMVSHQFRTPLAIVDSALQRLMRRADRLRRDELVERVGRSREAIARLTRLVESTLDAARLDAGQIEVDSRACDIGQLVAGICERQRDACPERDVILTAPGPEPVVALCDPTHVEHIVVNLLTNAVKYSPAMTPLTIVLGTGDGEAWCDVGNEGAIGPAAVRSRLFERYFRGENAAGLPGIGIGLHMARTLARMQGGDVSLVEATGPSTTFRLSLPQPSSAPSVLEAARAATRPKESA